MRHLALAFAAAVFSLPACAEIVTFEFTGMVNYLRQSINNAPSRAVVSSDLVAGGIAVGDTFSGRFSYDTAFKLSSSDAGYAHYTSNPANEAVPAATFVLNKSGTSWQADTTMSTYVGVFNGGSDAVYISPAPSWNPLATMWFSFYDDTGKVLPDLAIPGNLNFADFYSAEAELYVNTDSGTVTSRGMLTSLTRIAPVPEPSTYAMLFAGLAIVAGGAAHRRKPSVPLQDLKA